MARGEGPSGTRLRAGAGVHGHEAHFGEDNDRGRKSPVFRGKRRSRVSSPRRATAGQGCRRGPGRFGWWATRGTTSTNEVRHGGLRER